MLFNHTYQDIISQLDPIHRAQIFYMDMAKAQGKGSTPSPSGSLSNYGINKHNAKINSYSLECNIPVLIKVSKLMPLLISTLAVMTVGQRFITWKHLCEEKSNNDVQRLRDELMLFLGQRNKKISSIGQLYTWALGHHASSSTIEITSTKTSQLVLLDLFNCFSKFF